MHRRSPSSALLFLPFVWLLAGCGQQSTIARTTVTPHKGVSGRVHGGQNPVTGATIQLWQVNTATDGGLGKAMLTATVTSSDGTGNATNSNANPGNLLNTLPAGEFTITGLYTCPTPTTLVYITASGGNPGLAAGTSNPQSQMVTALGTCNNLQTNVQFVEIDERTTVATVASLYAFMSAYNAIGASPAHAADITYAFTLMNEYTDFQNATAPGPTLPANYSASTGDLNLLANILATCVNSSGGTAGDGSPCGNLFAYTYDATSNAYSTDVAAAALFIRKNDSTYAPSGLASLPTPQPPFVPASTGPSDWSLPIFELPLPPTFSLAPGTYTGPQLVHLQDADPAATIYTTNATGTYTLMVQGVLTVKQSETLYAIAEARGVKSSIASASYTVTTNPNAPTVSVTNPTVNAGSTAGINITASSTASGSVVTFVTTAAVGGTFSPASCTIASGSCSVTYTPSGNAAAGSYAGGLTATFGAVGTFLAATANATVYVVAADTFQVLGAANRTGLIQASDGYFYGSDIGETTDLGRIFRMDSSGNITTLYTFTGGTDGEYPEDHVIEGSDGLFYGVALRGGTSGNGTIFKVDASGNFTLLYTFTGSTDGARPGDNLVQGLDGSFYGSASQGGEFGRGTLFKIDTAGNFTLLHSFTGGADGFGSSALLQATDGSFYSVSGGGTYNAGIVYKMDTAGNLTTLYNFTGLADGQSPSGALVQGTDGNFYGGTTSAGPLNSGTLFKITPTGSLTTLHSFSGQEGANPFGALVEAADGAFYGSAFLGGSSYSGTLFKIDSAGNFTLLYQFAGTSDGNTPEYALVQGSDGSFYGTSAGAVYRLTPSPALAAPVQITVPLLVTHSSSFTLSYAVANAASKTMQQCFATNNGGDTTGWTGVKTAATTATTVTLTAPSTAGVYTYSLTCGGVESSLVQLVVDRPTPPVFSPVAGTYYTTQNVTLTDADPNAVMYYTTNGSNPTTGSTQYTGAITVSSSETLKAIAVESGSSSSVASAAYIIAPPLAPTVSLSAVTAVSGSLAAQNITASSNSDGSVVTFGTSSPVDGSFSPSTCTIANGSCTTAYLPSGVLATGTYSNGLTASFTATTMYTAASASSALTIAVGPSFSVLYNFQDDPNPNAPGGPTVQGSDGQFYGTASGGANQLGAAYKVDLSGNLTVLHTFTGGNDGSYPAGGLIEGTDGSFYGTAKSGGVNNKGTLFKIDSSGNFSVIYAFLGTTDGSDPGTGVIQGTDGNFYGTTRNGGGSAGYGVAFRVTPAGVFTALHTFTDGNDGASPNGLLQGSDGNFYGSAIYGGANSEGTLFKIDTMGNFTSLHSFDVTDGIGPAGTLVEGANGTFYGVAGSGGPTTSGGTIYEIDSSGNFTLLYSSLGGSDPEQIGSLQLGSDGNFYGVASGICGSTTNCGTLFRMDTAGNVLTLHSFLSEDGTDGALPYSTLVQASNGSLYGTASTGGTGYQGTLFELTPSPVLTAPITLTVPTSVTHGTTFTLSYAASNAYSKTMQQCYAANNGGDTSGWTGIKTASTTAQNATLTAPSTPGSYTYSLTCGGIESGFATLNVD